MFDNGFNITTVLVGLLNILIGGLLVAIVKSRPALKKIAAEREANLLSERALEMERMRERLSGLETSLALALEELRIVRHDLANANHSLDMFIALIEANPERSREHAAKVKITREAAHAALAEEKAELLRARVANIRVGQ